MDGYGGGTDSQQIHIYDVSNIAQPTLLSTVVTARGSNIHNIAMTESLILVANGWDGLTIIGKGDNQGYAIVSKFKIAGHVRGIFAEGNRAYVAASTAPGLDSEFAIVDISDPASPKKLASVETSGGAQLMFTFTSKWHSWQIGEAGYLRSIFQTRRNQLLLIASSARGVGSIIFPEAAICLSLQEQSGILTRLSKSSPLTNSNRANRQENGYGPLRNGAALLFLGDAMSLQQTDEQSDAPEHASQAYWQ